MPKIKVELPFSMRREGEAELLAFTSGVHEVDADVLKHWFVQACIKDGRAVLLGETALEAVPLPTEPLTEEQLRAISNRELTKMAQERGLTVPGKADKNQLVALLLEADPMQERAQGQE